MTTGAAAASGTAAVVQTQSPIPMWSIADNGAMSNLHGSALGLVIAACVASLVSTAVLMDAGSY